ncbi:MAG: hypothetical protein ABF608_06470 [Sporolactobacillus sp.]
MLEAGIFDAHVVKKDKIDHLDNTFDETHTVDGTETIGIEHKSGEILSEFFSKDKGTL